jgi:carboxylesterase type B
MKRPMKSFVLAIGLAAFACLASEDAATQSQSCFVNIGNGDVRGSDLGASCAFLGIPYAAPPVNALRWKPPQAAAPWTTPLDVVAPPSGCSSIVLPAGNLIGSEDCLKLNLWMPDPAPSTPAPARHIADARTPVFVYSYEYEIDDVFPNAAPHGVESNIIFGNDYVPARFPNHVLDAADLSLHAAMAGYWTRFARTGNPNVDDDSVVHWPAFKDPQGPGRAANKHIVFDTTIEAGKRLREVACDFWEPLFLRTTLNAPPAATP